MTRSCQTCEFYERGGSPEMGECRRQPPAAVIAITTGAVWPTVRPADWCGEWESRAIAESMRNA